MRHSVVLDRRVVAEGSEEAMRAAARLLHGGRGWTLTIPPAGDAWTVAEGWLCDRPLKGHVGRR